MRKIMFIFSVLFVSLALPHAALAQDAPAQSANKTAGEPPVHYYHLNLVVQQLGADGKPINSRSYSTTVTTDRQGSGTNFIRNSSQVRVESGTYIEDGKTKTSYEFFDIGINFDVRDVREVGHQLSLHIKAEVNGYAPPTESDSTLGTLGVRRHNQWESSVLIPVSKPAVIFSSDSLEGKRVMQVLATATLIP